MIANENDIVFLKEAGKRLGRVLAAVAQAAVPGVSTKELDELAEKLILDGGDVPAFKNYQPQGASYPYPATLCISVNDEVVHGIPNERVLMEGDIVGLDLGLIHNGYVVDSARTVAVGEISESAQKLMEATERALREGIKAAKAGKRVSDISAAIQKVAHDARLGIVRELGGHGVGKKVHEPPYIPNYVAGKGPELQAGMVLAIEPMFTERGEDIALANDGYTYKTEDAGLSAHFEHTILVTEGEPVILTLA